MKHNEQLPEASPLRHALGAIVLSRLAAHPLYFAAALPLRTLPPRFNRYRGGGTYGFHVDGSVMSMATAGGAQSLRTDLSCTLFLCEPDEYDGGELVVSDTYGEPGSAAAGRASLSAQPAQSCAVTRGARLAALLVQRFAADGSASAVRSSSTRHWSVRADAEPGALTG